MPKKLKDCVKKVMDSGKSESEAWAICRKSTGLKPHSAGIKSIKELPERPKDEWDPPHQSIVVIEDTEKGGGMADMDPEYRKRQQKKLRESREKFRKLREKHYGSVIEGMADFAGELDDVGLIEEADQIDSFLKSAQWQWIKEKGQQLKDWFQTERELDPQLRQALTNLRHNHWNLIKQVNAARSMLNNAWKNMGKPAYANDVRTIINFMQRDLQAALKAAQQAGVQVQQLLSQQTSGARPAEAPQSPEELEETQLIQMQPGDLEAHLGSIERLLKLAIVLDKKGHKGVACRIDGYLRKQAQMQSIRNVWRGVQDWPTGKLNPAYRQQAQIHKDLMNRLNNLYNVLQTARQNITDVPSYVDKFQGAISQFQTELGNITNEIANLGQNVGETTRQQPPAQPGATPVQPETVPAGQPAAQTLTTQPGVVQPQAPTTSVEEQPASPQAPTEVPASVPEEESTGQSEQPGEEAAPPFVGGEQPTATVRDVRYALTGLTPENRARVLEFIQQLHAEQQARARQ